MNTVTTENTVSTSRRGRRTWRWIASSSRCRTARAGQTIFNRDTHLKASKNRALQALRRARAWLAEHPELATMIAALVGLIAKLDAAIDRLRAASMDQEVLRVAALQRTATARRVRTELWKHHMVPIVVVARAVDRNSA